MTERIEKKKQLDDEMSRFEAEILGPNNVSPLPPPPIPPGLKTIIGTSTFDKIQQQLKQTNDIVPSLQPPPCLPNFNLPPMDGPPRAFRPPENVPRPFPPNFGPSQIGPMGPRPGPFMRQPNRPMGPGPHFMSNGDMLPPRFNPPPPPGFIPHQVNRMPSGPIMPGGPMPGPPRPGGFIHPPPPPPGLLMGEGKVGLPSPIIISKAPSIICSAPKLYTSKEPLDKPTVKKVAVASTDTILRFESKKKKVKVENKQQPESVAIEMAEKVKQTTVTTKVTSKSSTSDDKRKDKKSKKNLRYAGGQVWEDSTLGEWEHGDFRLFAGDLGNDVTDELLNRYFSHYPSFLKAKVVRDKRTNKSKGYGFISFRDSHDYIKAMKEINGKYVGSRPIKLRKSMWKERSFDVVQKKIKEKQVIGLK